jgi:hypothetical protein
MMSASILQGFLMRQIMAFILLAVAGTTHAEAIKGLRFVHHDWTLACDNTRTCRAAGYQKEMSDNQPVSLLLTRKAGPGEKTSAKLMLGQYEEIAVPEHLRLHINGSDHGTLSVADGDWTLSMAQTNALLAALSRNSRIVIIGSDGRHWTLSDLGAKAVLLKMDEFQGRLGSPGALVRKGNRSESSVLAALPAPTVVLAQLPPTRTKDIGLAQSPVLRAALQAATAADDCAGLSAEGSPLSRQPQPLTITRLSKDKLLASILCWRGAYNEGNGYWVINDKAPYRPILVTTSGSDDAGNTINAASKGRGLGDCWWTASWGWNGVRFVQTAEATTGLCRLVAAGGAWELPTRVTEVR